MGTVIQHKTTQGMVSHDNLPEIKKLYLQAVKDGNEQFEFKGMEFLTAYAKYLIEYMEMISKRR